jgi:hypothetical protein
MSRAFVIALLFSLCVAVASAQTAQPKPAFMCPDVHATKACASFLELRKAKDPAVLLERAEAVGMVCFRQNDDNFFVLFIKRGYIDDSATKRDAAGNVMIREWGNAYGRLTAFKEGVEDADNTVPVNFFKGLWYSFRTVPEAQYWNNNPDNDARYIAKAEDNDGVFVHVDSTIDISKTYKNVRDEDVDYHLSIQRSTGRFVESHTFKNQPAASTTGRCIALPR